MTMLKSILRSLKDVDLPEHVRQSYEREYINICNRSKGYVYLAWLETTPYYKIGFSINPETRFSNTITLPVDIVILHSIQTNNMHRLEKDLHQQFCNLHVRGEWFALSSQGVDYITSLSDVTYDMREL